MSDPVDPDALAEALAEWSYSYESLEPVLDAARAFLEAPTAECLECNGNGYKVVEHIRAVPEHHPSCVGGSECGSTCPVPAPHPEYEREPCDFCGGSGRVRLVAERSQE